MSRLAAAVAALALLAAGCGDGGSAPTGEGGTTRLKVQETAGVPSAFVAFGIEKGLFEKEKLDVELSPTQGGAATWDAPEIYTFGNGGQLKITLLPTNFNWGVFGTKPGNIYGGVVDARFELISESTAVPEPATWAMMIVGFGLAGTALRRRRAGLAIAA